MKILFRAFLVLVALVLGALAWDVWQLRRLQPPDDRTFEGFVRAGRQGSLLIDAPGRRLYWMTSTRTIVPYSEPATYEFDRSGALVNWSPGTSEGMLLNVPVRRNGKPATFDEARAWLR